MILDEGYVECVFKLIPKQIGCTYLILKILLVKLNKKGKIVGTLDVSISMEEVTIVSEGNYLPQPANTGILQIEPVWAKNLKNTVCNLIGLTHLGLDLSGF